MHIDSSENIYVSTTGSFPPVYPNSVRKIDAETNLISTLAGKVDLSFPNEGLPATEAQIGFPQGIALSSSGDLFIADRMLHRVYKVDRATGQMLSVAGNGTKGFSGDDGPSTEGWLNWPEGIFLDGSDNLFIADSGNLRIRRVDGQTGIITTVAGDGGRGFNGEE